MKRVAILQSNYIPWKGYFDLINSVDEFIIYDDMQYTRRDWRNRNRIKTPDRLMWLSVPVQVKGKYFQKINETLVSDSEWSKQHWDTIRQFYARAPYFDKYKDIFQDFYYGCRERFLSEINYSLIKIINNTLGINTTIRRSSDFELIDGQTKRLMSICRQTDAGIYVSGPAARSYFDEDIAEEFGITIEWFDYSGYPEYQQLYPPFEHGVSILDLLFNEGPCARDFMKSF